MTVPHQLDSDADAILKAVPSTQITDVGVLHAARARMLEMGRPPGPEVHSTRELVLDGPAGPLPVRLYRPSGEPSLPGVVYFHGGGMVLGSVDSFDATARRLTCAMNAAVLSVDYRLAPEHTYPTANNEAYFAAAWAVGHAAELGLDPARIAVAGDSAGGGLAASVCLQARDENGPRLSFQLLIYPGIDRRLDTESARLFADGPTISMATVRWMKAAYLGPETDRPDEPYAVPANASDLSGLPPAIMITAEVDPIRDSCERYGERLRAAGVETVLIRYPGVFHGFLSYADHLARARRAVDDIGALARARFSSPSLAR